MCSGQRKFLLLEASRPDKSVPLSPHSHLAIYPDVNSVPVAGSSSKTQPSRLLPHTLTPSTLVPNLPLVAALPSHPHAQNTLHLSVLAGPTPGLSTRPVSGLHSPGHGEGFKNGHMT